MILQCSVRRSGKPDEDGTNTGTVCSCTRTVRVMYQYRELVSYRIENGARNQIHRREVEQPAVQPAELVGHV